MSEFERVLPSYRLVQTHYGDDLQAVAIRELGDANRWAELVWINSLIPPYLTDDEAMAGPGVILNGQLIKVPSPTGAFTTSADTGQVYERDCLLVNKRLTDDGNGDFAIAAGVDNLKQQLQHRIDTPRGQMRRHPDYGCLIWRLKGRVNGPIAGAMGAQYIKAALAADYRVSAVTKASATVVGDRITATATAEAIAGSSVDLLTGA